MLNLPFKEGPHRPHFAPQRGAVDPARLLPIAAAIIAGHFGREDSPTAAAALSSGIMLADSRFAALEDGPQPYPERFRRAVSLAVAELVDKPADDLPRALMTAFNRVPGALDLASMLRRDVETLPASAIDMEHPGG